MLTPEFKDSDVDWIGKIPSHWGVKKLKYFAKIKNGQDQKEVIEELGEYPIYGSGGIFGKSKSFLYGKKSVLLGRKGTIDRPIYADVPFWTVDTMFYTEISDDVEPLFFYYTCKNIPFAKITKKTALPSMTKEDLNQVLFPSPPINEQRKISDFISNKINIIDKGLRDLENTILLLEEKR